MTGGVPPFAVARLPRIDFGPGRSSAIPDAVARYGRHVLIVTGVASFRRSERWGPLIAGLDERGIAHDEMSVEGEPSPELVQEAAIAHRSAGVDVVLGVGGGSVLDAAKAVAGLIRAETTVFDHLEGVGPELPYRGPAVPFVAVPTTAGTGSEATKNAVLSRHGPNGFKKSFRDEQLVAREAIVDPDLLIGCRPDLIAANGLDALTQLLESYVSARANPFTDALALSGLDAARDGLVAWWTAAKARAPAEATAAARSRMAYAALLSGICLAQAGLGAVHGLASPLGALFPIPHGVACGAVLAAATRVNIAALQVRDKEGPALRRYAEAGRVLAGAASVGHSRADAPAAGELAALLASWTARLEVPGLARYGVTTSDIPRIVAGSRGSSMKTNPILLSDGEVAGIVEASL